MLIKETSGYTIDHLSFVSNAPGIRLVLSNDKFVGVSISAYWDRQRDDWSVLADFGTRRDDGGGMENSQLNQVEKDLLSLIKSDQAVNKPGVVPCTTDAPLTSDMQDSITVIIALTRMVDAWNLVVRGKPFLLPLELAVVEEGYILGFGEEEQLPFSTATSAFEFLTKLFLRALQGFVGTLDAGVRVREDQIGNLIRFPSKEDS